MLGLAAGGKGMAVYPLGRIPAPGGAITHGEPVSGVDEYVPGKLQVGAAAQEVENLSQRRRMRPERVAAMLGDEPGVDQRAHPSPEDLPVVGSQSHEGSNH